MHGSGMDAFYAQLVHQGVLGLVAPEDGHHQESQSLRRELLRFEHDMTPQAHVFKYLDPS